MNENENIHPTPNSTEKEEPVAVPNENTVVQEPQKEVCVTADNIENPTASAESTEPKTEETKTEEPKTKKQTKKPSALVSIIVCLTIMFASACGVLMVSILASAFNGSSSTGKNTVIYQGSEWTNEGEVVSNEAIVNTVQKTSVSVVAITTESVSYYGNFVSEGAGSGVICSADGYIITNHHVIDEADNIRVTLENGDTHTATLIGSDSQTDLAVIKIDVEGLVPAVFANEGALKVGQTVIAIGNPLGTLSNTVTSGVVSALARQITISGTTMTLLQHNASVNPGNSGGGLFNLNGELVGIVNAKSSGTGIEGIGFAIPVETYKKVVQELIEYGYVTGRPMLGITAYEVLSTSAVYNLPEDVRTCVMAIGSTGLYVGDDAKVQYQKGSNHLQPGDYMISADDQLIKEFADLTKLISEKKIGDTVKITVYRYNKDTKKTVQVDVSIVLTERGK